MWRGLVVVAILATTARADDASRCADERKAVAEAAQVANAWRARLRELEAQLEDARSKNNRGVEDAIASALADADGRARYAENYGKEARSQLAACLAKPAPAPAPPVTPAAGSDDPLPPVAEAPKPAPTPIAVPAPPKAKAGKRAAQVPKGAVVAMAAAKKAARDAAKAAAKEDRELAAAVRARAASDLAQEIAARRRVAHLLDQEWVSKGIDADVSVGGREGRTLRIRYFGCNRPLVYQIQHGDLDADLVSAGFTRIDCTDGFGGGASGDL